MEMSDLEAAICHEVHVRPQQWKPLDGGDLGDLRIDWTCGEVYTGMSYTDLELEAHTLK